MESVQNQQAIYSILQLMSNLCVHSWNTRLQGERGHLCITHKDNDVP